MTRLKSTATRWLKNTDLEQYFSTNGPRTTFSKNVDLTIQYQKE